MNKTAAVKRIKMCVSTRVARFSKPKYGRFLSL